MLGWRAINLSACWKLDVVAAPTELAAPLLAPLPGEIEGGGECHSFDSHVTAPSIMRICFSEGLE